MSGRLATGAYVIGLVVVIVGTDVALFRHHTWARLVLNIGIVLVFAAFYLRFQGAFGKG